MDWNKDVTKGPLPIWAIILFAILSGCFCCLLVGCTSKGLKLDVPHILLCFSLGASGYLYLWFLSTLAKNPPPWLR